MTRPRRPMTRSAVLCLDTASPTVSVALARAGCVLGEEREAIARSSVRLLPMIDEVLRRAELPLSRLGGLVVLAGPGSFTGLRVGMATALGLHQASGVAATAVSTFDALAAWHRSRQPDSIPPPPPPAALGAVDVLRGEWAVRSCDLGTGEQPRRLPAEALIAEAVASGATIVGFGTRRLLDLAAPAAGSGLSVAEPDALAPPAAAALSLAPPAWEPARLTRPIYFRPPAVTVPRRS